MHHAEHNLADYVHSFSERSIPGDKDMENLNLSLWGRGMFLFDMSRPSALLPGMGPPVFLLPWLDTLLCGPVWGSMGAYTMILQVEYGGSHYDTSGIVWGLTLCNFR